MTEPEQKRSLGAIIGRTVKRLIGAVFGGLGLLVMGACIIGLIPGSEEATLKDCPIIISVGLVFFAVGACIRQLCAALRDSLSRISMFWSPKDSKIALQHQ